ncbi:MAG: prepilin-type N-terminal cleavage/methylation domain-containing protein [Gemmatimonadetes bacterium]|nr:prepilin-type N-terminal cleavage/methylation domain-containing protein [Gemmatimonadota bacterium]
MTRTRDRHGFTLIELLIVVVIIGILAAIAIPKFSSTREKAFRSSMMADLKNLAAAQELYHNTHYTYHTVLADLKAVESEGVTLTINEGTGQGWAATASHAGIASEQCGLYHGNAAPAGGDPATVPGVIACSF